VGSLADKIRQAGRVGLDTSLFIFYLEDHPRYLSLCDEVFDLLEQGGAEAVTSTVNLLEVLVQPLALGKADLVNEYRSFLTETPHLTLRILILCLPNEQPHCGPATRCVPRMLYNSLQHLSLVPACSSPMTSVCAK
jgi:hypothetical protein